VEDPGGRGGDSDDRSADLTDEEVFKEVFRPSTRGLRLRLGLGLRLFLQSSDVGDDNPSDLTLLGFLLLCGGRQGRSGDDDPLFLLAALPFLSVQFSEVFCGNAHDDKVTPALSNDFRVIA
jgi:hypothetical protein